MTNTRAIGGQVPQTCAPDARSARATVHRRWAAGGARASRATASRPRQARPRGSKGRRNDTATDDRAWRGCGNRIGVPSHHRGPDTVPISPDCRGIPRLDTGTEAVGRAGLQWPDLEMGRPAVADLLIRGCKRLATPDSALVGIESLGRSADEACRRQEGQGCGRSQGRRHPALHLDGRHLL